MTNEMEMNNLLKNDILTKRLMNQAYDYGFNVIKTNDYESSHTPAAVNPFYKTIVLNSKWHEPKQLPFQLAHEMGHLLNKDGQSSCLYFSPSKYGIEGNANRTAIKLLLPYYLDDNIMEHVSSVRIMESLDMDQYLEGMVQEEILKYYSSFD